MVQHQPQAHKVASPERAGRPPAPKCASQEALPISTLDKSVTQQAGKVASLGALDPGGQLCGLLLVQMAGFFRGTCVVGFRGEGV